MMPQSPLPAPSCGGRAAALRTRRQFLAGSSAAWRWPWLPAWPALPVTESCTARRSSGTRLQNVRPDQGNIAAVHDLIEAVEKDRLPKADILAARMGLEMITAVFESQRLDTRVTWPLRSRHDPLEMF